MPKKSDMCLKIHERTNFVLFISFKNVVAIAPHLLVLVFVFVNENTTAWVMYVAEYFDVMQFARPPHGS